MESEQSDEQGERQHSREIQSQLEFIVGSCQRENELIQYQWTAAEKLAKASTALSPSNVVVVGFSIVECQKSALTIEKNTQIEVQNAWARLSPTIFTIFLHRIGNKSPGLAKK